MRLCFGLAALLVSVGLLAGQARAVSILAPGDAIIAIDTDGLVPSGNSSTPPSGNENAQFAFDGNNGTKYLNFGETNSGVIVTPAGGATIVESFRMVTGGDAPERDPFSFMLWGTNDPITSTNNSFGLNENWVLIDGFDLTGALELPEGRGALGPLVDFNGGGVAYSSYKLLFPTVRDANAANSMQVAEIQFFTDDAGTSPNVFLNPSQAIAIDYNGLIQNSNYPAGEAPSFAIDGDWLPANPVGSVPGDGDAATKYLNFGRENSGFIVTPASGASVVRSFQITTPNDAAGRDPSSWELWGTNDPITSADNTDGNLENWVLIEAGTIELPTDRYTPGPFVNLTGNETEYTSYKMVFPTIRDPNAANSNSMQIGEIQFFTNRVIPEPSTIALIGLGLVGVVAGRRFARR